MNGSLLLKKRTLETKIDELQDKFDQNKKNGLTDFNTLNEINKFKDELNSLDSCDIHDEGCVACGS